MERQRGASFDTMLLASIILLAGSGLAMLFSASYTDAIETRHVAGYYFQRQAIMFGLGSILAIIIAYFPIEFFRKCAKMIWVVVIGLNIAACFGPDINGASRWILIMGISIQPSEFLKIALILYLASDFVRIEDSHGKRNYRFAGFAIGCSCLLVLFGQSDFSTTVFICGLCFAMLFISKMRVRWIFLIMLMLVFLVLIVVWKEPYRWERIMSYMSGNADTSGSGYQITRALQALEAGGFWGRGIGSGSFKMGSLPEAKSDFIFAIVGEELGFIGVGIIILLFAFFGFRGYQIAYTAKDKFSSYVAFGVTTSILFQMLVNVAVVAEVFPTTGITMPFFSQGGTSMLVTMIMCGFLLNVSRNSGQGDNYEQY